MIHSAADANSNIIFGAVIDEEHGRRDPRHRDRHRLRPRARGGGGFGGSRAAGRSPDRGPRIDDRQRSSLEISDDDIDIPPFLR